MSSSSNNSNNKRRDRGPPSEMFLHGNSNASSLVVGEEDGLEPYSDEPAPSTTNNMPPSRYSYQPSGQHHQDDHDDDEDGGEGQMTEELLANTNREEVVEEEGGGDSVTEMLNFYSQNLPEKPQQQTNNSYWEGESQRHDDYYSSQQQESFHPVGAEEDDDEADNFVGKTSSRGHRNKKKKKMAQAAYNDNTSSRGSSGSSSNRRRQGKFLNLSVSTRFGEGLPQIPPSSIEQSPSVANNRKKCLTLRTYYARYRTFCRWSIIMLGISLVVILLLQIFIQPNTTPTSSGIATGGEDANADPDAYMEGTTPWHLVIDQLPIYSQKIIAYGIKTKPQYIAAQWMAMDPNLHEYLNVSKIDNNSYNDENNNNGLWRFQQRYALATIYFSLNGLQWKCTNDNNNNDGCSSHNWLHYDIPECEWIQTNQDDNDDICNEYGQYQYLSLHSMTGMKGGTIPKEIALLTNLKHIKLSRTDLNVDVTHLLPSTMENLQKLQIINYSYSQLIGSVPYQPLIKLRQLEALILNDNNLEGKAPTQLFRLPHFKHLKVYNNPAMEGEELHNNDMSSNGGDGSGNGGSVRL